jgi:hypothetical protein
MEITIMTRVLWDVTVYNIYSFVYFFAVGLLMSTYTSDGIAPKDKTTRKRCTGKDAESSSHG